MSNMWAARLYRAATIVDVAVLYPHGRLGRASDLIDAFGFQPQQTSDPFPEERPMRVGALAHYGNVFQIHVHIQLAGSPRAYRENLLYRLRYFEPSHSFRAQFQFQDVMYTTVAPGSCRNAREVPLELR